MPFSPKRHSGLLGFFMAFYWALTYETTIAPHSYLWLQGKGKSTLIMPHRYQVTCKTTILFSPHCRDMRRIIGLVFSLLPGHVQGNKFVVFLVSWL